MGGVIRSDGEMRKCYSVGRRIFRNPYLFLPGNWHEPIWNVRRGALVSFNLLYDHAKFGTARLILDPWFDVDTE